MDHPQNFVHEGAEYNTARSPLKIAEYGRNVHKMIDYLKNVEDREKRTKLAFGIINIMGQLAPQQKEQTDYRHTLWDHLHIIGNFEIDVDSPYPKPSPDILTSKPIRLPYPKSKILFMHYGKIFQNMIKHVAKMEDGDEKSLLTRAIGNGMKRSYLTWNRESVTDEIIADHINILSEGTLKLDPSEILTSTQDILNSNRKKKKPGSSNSNNNNNNSNSNNNNFKTNNFQKNGFNKFNNNRKNNNNRPK